MVTIYKDNEWLAVTRHPGIGTVMFTVRLSDIKNGHPALNCYACPANEYIDDMMDKGVLQYSKAPKEMTKYELSIYAGLLEQLLKS